MKAFLAVVAMLGTTLALSGASGAASGVRFGVVPARVVAGQQVTVTVATAVTRCSLAVRYRDGKKQDGLLPASSIGSLASWQWQVVDTTAAGAALVTATCGKARLSRTMLIVGSLIPPKIVVVKSGFSIRPKFSGTEVS